MNRQLTNLLSQVWRRLPDDGKLSVSAALGFLVVSLTSLVGNALFGFSSKLPALGFIGLFYLLLAMGSLLRPAASGQPAPSPPKSADPDRQTRRPPSRDRTAIFQGRIAGPRESAVIASPVQCGHSLRKLDDLKHWKALAAVSEPDLEYNGKRRHWSVAMRKFLTDLNGAPRTLITEPGHLRQ